MTKTLKNISLLLILALLASCSADRKLAKTFITAEKNISLLVMEPDFLYKISLKDYEIEDEEALSEAEKDSILYSKSLYLQYISDTTFISKFVRSYMNGLEKYGYTVYPEENLADFFNDTSESFIINIAQLSLEEFVYPYESEFLVYDEVFSINGIDLNAMNVNAWFEIQKANAIGEKPQILFASDPIFDELQGEVKQQIFQRDMYFEYNIDSLTLDNVFLYTEKLAAKYSGYTYDYFLNKYILEKGDDFYYEEKPYYHYDPKTGDIEPAYDQRFIEIE